MSFHYISFRYISFLCCNTFRYIKFLFWCFGLIISCYIIFFLLLLRQIPLHQFLLYQFPFLVTSDSDVTISVLLLYQFPLNQFPLYQSPLYQFPFFVTTDSVISISWKNVTSHSVLSNSVLSTSHPPLHHRIKGFLFTAITRETLEETYKSVSLPFPFPPLPPYPIFLPFSFPPIPFFPLF